MHEDRSDQQRGKRTQAGATKQCAVHIGLRVDRQGPSHGDRRTFQLDQLVRCQGRQGAKKRTNNLALISQRKEPADRRRFAAGRGVCRIRHNPATHVGNHKPS